MSLDVKRAAMSNLAGGITECPLRYFIRSLLPAPSANAPTIKAITQLLDIQSGWSKTYAFSESRGPLVDEDKIFGTLATSETLKGGIPEQPKLNSEPRALADRVQYRIVFMEAGVPLFQLGNLGDIWQAVCDANEALVAMQRRGYIHRDINASNIILWNKIGIISDLEFSALYNPNANVSGSRGVLTVSFRFD
ncbi:hypothetical protein BDV93DRAFT_227556 [Ceratobasidium sp. AG-I]|nr:hypothetical protein BDV93DRAFT_227556 [Ceratobasidium sp. AG-I]